MPQLKYVGSGVAYQPLEEKDMYYNMNHEHRGIALIFNHEKFESVSKRNGTNIDRDKLYKVLTKLKFDVKPPMNDFTYAEISNYLQEVAKLDHSGSDCLLITVLTHGELGMLHAKDVKYSLKKLWCHFTDENCPSLAGKPKIFFIQACRGGKYDNGINLVTDYANQPPEVLFNNITTLSVLDEKDEPTALSENPTQADFIFGFSSAPDYYAWRNDRNGTWFIQTVCEELLDYKNEPNLMKILTNVARRVAIDFKSNTPKVPASHEKKQIPSIHSTLTRHLYLRKKK